MTDVKLRFDKLEHTFNKIGLDACLNEANNNLESDACNILAAFKPIEAKYGYQDLKNIGFFAYNSDGWGDWHRNSKIPGIAVVGSYQGYVIHTKTDSGYFAISDNELGGYRNKIKKDDVKTLKRRIIEVKSEE